MDTICKCQLSLGPFSQGLFPSLSSPFFSILLSTFTLLPLLSPKMCTSLYSLQESVSELPGAYGLVIWYGLIGVYRLLESIAQESSRQWGQWDLLGTAPQKYNHSSVQVSLILEGIWGLADHWSSINIRVSHMGNVRTKGNLLTTGEGRAIFENVIVPWYRIYLINIIQVK